MSKREKQQATSTELTGGAGFTYEDAVVAYYLTALLREERAPGLDGIVKAVAAQQSGHDQPMDDIIVEFEDNGSRRSLSLQAKRRLTISAAPTNTDFRDIIARAVATRATNQFDRSLDAYGFVAETVALPSLQTLNRLIEWAKSSPSGEHFTRRFEAGGTAAAAERSLRDEIAPLINAQSPDDEKRFYTQLVALNFSGLAVGGLQRTDTINRLRELVVNIEGGHDLLLFDRLCQLARDGASVGRKWTRQTVLSDLRGVVRLKVAPNYARDVGLLQSFSLDGMADVSDNIDGSHIDRPSLENSVRERLTTHRLVNISGLPGCGKSAVLKRVVSNYAANGPFIFLKSDRLVGNSWQHFATALGLMHTGITDLLAEIGSSGTPILFIDGIDRIKPDQRGVITDILRAIEEKIELADWRVLATSRDQGLETYRAWFPPSFYKVTGIGDVAISGFSDHEAEALAVEKPNLRRLLFASTSVREIARRPFFASVLARSISEDSETPKTEVDLISAWWRRAGHNAPEDAAPQRQRALLDLAESGVPNLGKNIRTRELKDTTVAHIVDLRGDLLIREHADGAFYSFTHDIFFEWAFFRLLIDLGDNWTNGLAKSGEPPLLGRVVGLLAQNALASRGKWLEGYRHLKHCSLRTQWRREWLTAAPLSPIFDEAVEEFQSLISDNDYELLETFLVWFQAKHTIPNPVILQRISSDVEGLDQLGIAALLSWPSDFEGWGRFLDWLLPLAPHLPARLLPHVLEVLSVWQNVFADRQNIRSSNIIEVCASWLIELETVEYSDRLSYEHGRLEALSSEARASVVSALRMMIIRSARSYPAPAIALFERAVANERMRHKAYAELMGFAPVMADVAPELLVALAKAELLGELPQDQLDREEREQRTHAEWLRRARSTPEHERTTQQTRALEHISFPMGRSRSDHDDIGINRHHTYYFPASPIHEPFASLFARKPELALELIRDLANHATKGWRQVQLLNRRRMGTPIPIVLEFPWGRQEFWGNWPVYNWFMGQLAPNALQCAFLALSYWAFRQIEDGRPADEVIRAVIEQNSCCAVLGLGLLLALETQEVSATTFPLVTCQRLWHHDLARLTQEPMRNFDLLGIGYLSELTGEKAKAKDFIESRKAHRREVRDLAMRFAITSDISLRSRFKETLARFPDDLPFEIEEERSSPEGVASLKERAECWAGLGDITNYRGQKLEDDKIAISYEAPIPLTPDQEVRLAESTTSLQEYSVIGWATKSLQSNALAEGLNLIDAIAFAQARDGDTVLKERRNAGEHSAQTTVTAVAAVAILFGTSLDPYYDWAWDVMVRVAAMKEPEDAYHASEIPWHPAKHLIRALVHDRRSRVPRADSVHLMLKLASHSNVGVAKFAFSGLFLDSDEHVRWVAAQLAVDLAHYYRFEIGAKGERDHSADRAARSRSLARALRNLARANDLPLSSIPSAWVKVAGRHQQGRFRGGEIWNDPDPSFDAAFAAQIFPLLPIEAWCQSNRFKNMVATSLRELVAWTAERLMPSWLEKTRWSDHNRSSLIEWNRVLGDLLARAAPFFETNFVRQEFLAPFLTEDDEGLAVLTGFVDWTVTRQVFDAPTIPENTLNLLESCVERVIRDRDFSSSSYRAGQVRGFDMPDLVRALLFVSIKELAPGAARFANGDWSQIGIVMPIVTKLTASVGWSTFVMQNYLTLCERAGLAYPVSAFADQTCTILDSLSESTKANWVGTTLPARTAAAVQRLADANFPLGSDLAQKLLRVLDALIDLGDRRSAALEQAEAFRGVQMSAV